MTKEETLPKLFLWLKEIYEKFEEDATPTSSASKSAGDNSD
jgi:hypothetical protein